MDHVEWRADLRTTAQIERFVAAVERIAAAMERLADTADEGPDETPLRMPDPPVVLPGR